MASLGAFGNGLSGWSTRFLNNWSSHFVRIWGSLNFCGCNMKENTERVTDFSALLPLSDYEPKDTLIIAEPGHNLEGREEFHLFRGESNFGRWEGLDPVERVTVGERDGFDPFSTFLMGSKKGVIRYGCRLIDGEKNIDGRRARISINPELIEPGPCFEISRFLVSRRIGGSAVFEEAIYTLCELIAMYAFFERGYEHLYSNTNLGLHRYFARIFGEYLEPLGDAQIVNKHDGALALVPSIVRRRHAEAILDRFRQKLACRSPAQSRMFGA